MRVLCINAGSSSIKVSLYEVDETDSANSSSGSGSDAGSSSSSSCGSSSAGASTADLTLPAGVRMIDSKSLKAGTLQHYVEQQQKDERCALL